MAYFDNAATTYPKPNIVYDFMNEFYRNYGSSFGRGSYKSEQTVSMLVSDTRRRIQELLHCSDKIVIFTPTATIAINMVIQGLLKDNIKNVYITPFEHNAVTRVLEYYKNKKIIDVNIITVSPEYVYDNEKIKYQFNDKKPDLLIMSHASNVTGLIAPVEKIASLAKEYGAITIIDMAQTAGLIDINVGLEDIDFAIFAGHKTLYAPTGISGFVMNQTLCLEPVLFGGTGYDSANQEMPSEIPERFEIGTLNTQAIAGLNASLKWIEKIGIENLYEKEHMNREKLKKILNEYDFIDIVGDSTDSHYIGIVSFLIKGISSDSAATIFKDKDLAVRTGLHCAPLAHKFLGTFPAGTIRLSTSYFTREEDIDELITVLNYIEDNI